MPKQLVLFSPVLRNQSLAHSDVTGAVIGAAMAVHRTLGAGFPEVVYQRALAVEMAATRLRFDRELSMPVFYREVEVGVRRVDFLVAGTVLVELKALPDLTDTHIAQALNYLTAYRMDVALLLNFGATSLQYRRLNSKRTG